MRSLLVAFALVCLAAGCVARPAVVDRSATYELLAYMTMGSHEHQGVVTSVAYLLPRGAAPDMPQRCQALRDGLVDARDACELRPRDPAGARSEIRDSPWTIMATWRLNVTEASVLQRTVQALDGRGHVVATWAGARTPDAAYITE